MLWGDCGQDALWVAAVDRIAALLWRHLEHTLLTNTRDVVTAIFLVSLKDTKVNARSVQGFGDFGLMRGTRGLGSK